MFTALIGFFNAGTATATQVHMIDIAKDSQPLGAALNQSALSRGNSVGSFMGGAAIASGLGYQAPAVAGAAIFRCWLDHRRDRRQRRTSRPTSG